MTKKINTKTRIFIVIIIVASIFISYKLYMGSEKYCEIDSDCYLGYKEDETKKYQDPDSDFNTYYTRKTRCFGKYAKNVTPTIFNKSIINPPFDCKCEYNHCRLLSPLEMIQQIKR